MKNKVFYALLVSLLSLVAMPVIREAFNDMNYPPLDGTVRLIFMGLFAISFAIFGYYLYLAGSLVGKALSLRRTLFLSLLIGIIFLCAKPVFSIDLRCYIMHGRLMSVYGSNPYLVQLGTFANDPFSKGLFWSQTTAVYGPLWMLISGFASLIAGNSSGWNLVMMKLPALGAYLLLIGQGYSLAAKICPKRKDVVAAFLAFNPFILTQYLMDGHNDILMFSLAVFAVNLIYDKRFIRGYIVFAASILVKYTSVALMPFLLVLVYERSEYKLEFLKQTVFFALISLFAAVALFLPFMESPAEFFRNFMEHKLMGSRGMDTNTIPYALLMIVQKAGGLKGMDISEPPKYIFNIFHMLFLCSSAAIFVRGWFIRKDIEKVFSAIAWTFIVYFIFEAFSFGAWFLIWLLPFLILSDIRKSPLLAVLLSLAGAISFWKRLSFMLIFCVGIYYVIIFISGIRRNREV